MPTLSDAIAEIKAGRRDEAREMLTWMLSMDQRNIMVLLWLTEVAQNPEERRKYLKRVIEIDPANAAARRGLELLDKANEQPPLAAIGRLSPSRPAPGDAANGHRLSPDETKPQQIPRATPPSAPIKVTPPEAKRTKEQKVKEKKIVVSFVAAIVALMLVVMIGIELVNLTVENSSADTQAAPMPQPAPTENTISAECASIARWLQGTSARLSEVKPMTDEIGKVLNSGASDSDAISVLEAYAPLFKSLAADQANSDPPDSLRSANEKIVSSFTLGEIGVQVLARAIENDSELGLSNAAASFKLSLKNLNEGKVLWEAVANQCK